jgi:DNA (cytosine-5)-methyltransferase 1
MKLQYYTIRENRGRPRIWLEGKRLTAMGISRGDRFITHKVEDGVNIEINPDGRRKVSGKGDRPIIDIVGKDINHWGFDIGDDVKIIYNYKWLFIRRRDEDA